MDDIDKVLEHIGVKGMRWGHRKRSSLGSDPKDPEPVKLTIAPGQRVKTAGGGGRSASDDAKAAAAYRQIARKSSVDALSNEQLRKLTTRIELESKYAKIAAADNQTKSKGRKFVEGFVKEELNRVVNGRDPQIILIGKAINGGAGAARGARERATSGTKGYVGRRRK